MNTDINRLIGKRIRFLRKERGYSLVEFAQMIYCSKSALSKYERGETSIDVERLADMALALDMPLSRLIEDNPLTRSSKEPIFNSDVPAPDGDKVTALYGYTYGGHTKQALYKHVLLSDGNTTTFYGEVDNELDYSSYKYSYSGRCQCTDSFVRLLLENPLNEKDILVIEYQTPLSRTSSFTGFFCTLSVGRFYPLATKILLSRTPVTDPELLKSKLCFTREELKQFRAHNSFYVP